jgi:hypothetical protein
MIVILGVIPRSSSRNAGSAHEQEGREAQSFHPAISATKILHLCAPRAMAGCDRCRWRIRSSSSNPAIAALRRRPGLRDGLFRGTAASALGRSAGPARAAVSRNFYSPFLSTETHPASRKIIHPTCSTGGVASQVLQNRNEMKKTRVADQTLDVDDMYW